MDAHVEELVSLKKILDGPDLPDALCGALTRLESFGMTVALLESTQIGLSVAKLRKHSTGPVSDASKRLVESWRGLLRGSNAAGSPSPAATPTLKRSSSETSTRSEDAEAKRSRSDASLDADSQPRPEDEKPSAAPLRSSGKSSATKHATESRPKAAPPPQVSEEELRANCRQMLREAMETPPLPTAEGARSVEDIAQSIEEALFAACGGASKDYRTRFRTLFLNLKNRLNSELRLRLRYSELGAERLVSMSSDELAPREVQEEKARIAKWQKEAVIRGVNKDQATDMFRCSKCQQRKTTYFEMQTRSADEPMTVFITCLNCGNRWKM